MVSDTLVRRFDDLDFEVRSELSDHILYTVRSSGLESGVNITDDDFKSLVQSGLLQDCISIAKNYYSFLPDVEIELEYADLVKLYKGALR